MFVLCVMIVSRCVLRVVCLLAVCGMLFGAWCEVFAVWFWLLFVRWLMAVGCDCLLVCLLVVVGCLFFAV